MRRTASKVVFASLILVLGGLVGCAGNSSDVTAYAATQASPTIDVGLGLTSSGVIQIGLVPGDTRRAVKRVAARNVGPKPFAFEKFVASCHCVHLKCVPEILGAGEVGDLHVEVDLSDDPGFKGNLAVEVVGYDQLGQIAIRLTVRLSA